VSTIIALTIDHITISGLLLTIFIIYTLIFYLIKDMVNVAVLEDVPSVSICGTLILNSYNKFEGVYTVRLEDRRIKLCDNSSMILHSLAYGESYMIKGTANIVVSGLLFPHTVFEMQDYTITLSDKEVN
jgi:hypothetical protein